MLNMMKTTEMFEKARKPHWFPDNLQVKTKLAAKKAAELADARMAGGEAKPDVEDLELFVHMHVCAYQAARKRSNSETIHQERQAWLLRRQSIRSFLVERNVGLVYLCLGRIRGVNRDVDELRSEGLMTLVRAVDWFDPWRGVRFSTYAFNAIIRSLSRLERRSAKHRRMFSSGYELAHESPTPQEHRSTDLFIDRLRRAVESNAGELTPKESRILDLRFPVGDAPRLTLGEIGADYGLSKERVRQIQNRALSKLRGALESDPALQ